MVIRGIVVLPLSRVAIDDPDMLLHEKTVGRVHEAARTLYREWHVLVLHTTFTGECVPTGSGRERTSTRKAIFLGTAHNAPLPLQNSL